MSQLRQRAKAVRAKGAAQRRNWDPSADSPSFRRYLWWCKRRNQMIERENYCHYWRVCLIWAPLWKLADVFIRLARPLICLVVALVAGCLTYGVLQFWHTDGGFWYKLGQVALWALGTVWVIGGLILAIWVIGPLIPEKDEPERMAPSMDQRSAWLSYVGVALTMPMFLAVSLLLALIMALVWVAEKRIVPRAMTWLCTAHFTGSKWFGWFRFVYLFPATLVGLACFYTWAQLVLVVVLASLAIAACFVGLSWWADRHTQRQRAEREAARERAAQRRIDQLLRIKFIILHPEQAGHEHSYQAWLQRYRRYVERQFGTTAFELEDIHLLFVSQRYDRYLARHAKPPAKPVDVAPVTPSRPSRFDRVLEVLVDGLLRAIDVAVDFLSLVWSAIVVKKWGICPLVELPTHLEGELRNSGPVLEG